MTTTEPKRSWVRRHPIIVITMLIFATVVFGLLSIALIPGHLVGACPGCGPEPQPSAWPSDVSAFGSLLSGIAAIAALIVTIRDRRSRAADLRQPQTAANPAKPAPRRPQKPSGKRRRR